MKRGAHVDCWVRAVQSERRNGAMSRCVRGDKQSATNARVHGSFCIIISTSQEGRPLRTALWTWLRT